jgi:fatty-acyl-CoA synthase
MQQFQQEKILGAREVEHDDFANYRQKYPGRRKRNHTWKYRLEMYARMFPKRPAMIQGDRVLNWDQFNRRCNRLAHGMERLGIRKEERVAIVGFNSIEWMEVHFAAAKVGAVPVNVNPRFVPDEVRYVLEDSDAAVAFVEEPYAGLIEDIKGELPLLRDVVVYGVGVRPGKVPGGMRVYDDVLSPDESNPKTRIYNDDFSILIYTGGTTGYPKGTVWDFTQRVRGLDMMLVNNIVPIFDAIADYPDDAIAGISRLLGSDPKVEKALTAVMASKPARAFWRSDAGKNAVLAIFKAMAGNPWVLKVAGAMQKAGVRLLCAAPLFHGAGIEGAFTYLGAIAACIVFLPTPHPFIAREFWETVERHRVHTAVIVGDAFALPMMEELEKAEEEGRPYDLRSLWAIVSSGVRLSSHVKRELLKHHPGLLIVDTLGTSESSGAFATINASTDSEIKPAGARLITEKSGFYRKQVYSNRVVNPETGKDVVPGSGEVGEFLFGGWMTLGYWKCPEKTKRDFRVIDGQRWFFGGDEGTVEEDGRFNLIGRGGGYLINSGGEKVYSEEVEELVKSHPKVWDAAVVGVPDPRWGQAVTALVELRPGEEATPEEIIDYCRDRIAGYKRPRHVFIVDKVPRAAAGKIDRAMAMSMIAGELDQGEKT